MRLMDGGPPLHRREISCKVMCVDSGDLLRSVDTICRESWKEQAVENAFSAVLLKKRGMTYPTLDRKYKLHSSFHIIVDLMMKCSSH